MKLSKEKQRKQNQEEFIGWFEPATQIHLRNCRSVLEHKNGRAIKVGERVGKLTGFSEGSNHYQVLMASLIKFIHEETKKGTKVFN